MESHSKRRSSEDCFVRSTRLSRLYASVLFSSHGATLLVFARSAQNRPKLIFYTFGHARVPLQICVAPSFVSGPEPHQCKLHHLGVTQVCRQSGSCFPFILHPFFVEVPAQGRDGAGRKETGPTYLHRPGYNIAHHPGLDPGSDPANNYFQFSLRPHPALCADLSPKGRGWFSGLLKFLFHPTTFLKNLSLYLSPSGPAPSPHRGEGWGEGFYHSTIISVCHPARIPGLAPGSRTNLSKLQQSSQTIVRTNGPTLPERMDGETLQIPLVYSLFTVPSLRTTHGHLRPAASFWHI